MGFIQIEKILGARPAVNRVAVSKSAGNNQLSFYLSDDVHLLMGRPSRYEAFVGDGDDKGAMFLRAATEDAPNSYAVYPNGRGVKFSVNADRAKFTLTCGVTEADFHMVDGGILVTLPTSVKAPVPHRPRTITVNTQSAAA